MDSNQLGVVYLVLKTGLYCYVDGFVSLFVESFDAQTFYHIIFNKLSKYKTEKLIFLVTK